jgi:glycosyltransferase involved in cell wall biosynthesis
MTDELPSVSVIIPARPEQREIKAAIASAALDYPKEKIEIIIARGKQPSIQRNKAIAVARNNIIYFLDDDSVPPSDNLRKAVAHFLDPKVVMVGGPNLCPPDAPRIEKSFALTMAAWIAFGPSRSRYSAIGAVRPSSEKELILCNLLARRDAVVKLGGFDETLYPNEENALMDDLQKQGGILLYDPNIAVLRRPRSSLKAFVKMLMNYGRGRAEQFRLHPTPGSVLNFVPPLFLIYLISWPWIPAMARELLFLYFFILFVQGFALVGIKNAAQIPGLVFLILITHIFYGLGFWRGLFTNLKRDTKSIATTVELEHLPPKR